METRVVQISTMRSVKAHTKSVRTGSGRLKTTEPTARGRATDIRDASQVPLPSVGQSRREQFPVKAVKQRPREEPVMVPVLSSLNKPLMPCHQARARELLKAGKAINRWYRGIRAIKLLNRQEGKIQQVAVGIDPGSKREAFTVMSRDHTYLNVLSDAVTWVGDRMKIRMLLRQVRRSRKTPFRKRRLYRNINTKFLPPSTKSRWQIKLNIVKFLKKLYPITDMVVENATAKSRKGARHWNSNFSPIELGKAWFYHEMSKMGNLVITPGYDVAKRRTQLHLKKIFRKLSETFFSHNVDSWLLASFVTEKNYIDNKSIFRIVPLQLHRRFLQRLNFIRGGRRSLYGGTKSQEFRRGSVVQNTKWGLVYVGGTRNGKISLHNMKSGKRLTDWGSCKETKFLYLSPWRTQFLPIEST